MKTTKRILALLLVLAMTLSNLPVAALAEELSVPAAEEFLEEGNNAESDASSIPETEAMPSETAEAPAESTEVPADVTEAPPAVPAEVPEESSEEGAALIVEESSGSTGAFASQTRTEVLPVASFHTGSTPNAENMIENNTYYVNPYSAVEFYFYFDTAAAESNGVTFVPVEGSFRVDQTQFVTMEKVSDSLYKLKLTGLALAKVKEGTFSVDIRCDLDYVNSQTNESGTATGTILIWADEAYTSENFHSPYLGYHWLTWEDDTWFEGESSGLVDQFNSLPRYPFWVIFYAADWSEEAGEWIYTPVHYSEVEYDSSLYTLGDVQGSVSGVNKDYYTMVTPNENAWSVSSDMYYIDPNGVYHYMDCWLGVSDGEFYLSPDHSVRSADTRFIIDPDAEENAFWWYYNDHDDTTEVINIYWTDNQDKISIEQIDGNHEMKITFTEDAVENAEAYGYYTITMISEIGVKDTDGKYVSTYMINTSMYVYPPQIEEVHDPYLTFGWLQNDGQGWYETGVHVGTELRIMPGQDMFHIYYLNTWDSEAGEYVATPVHVQAADGDLTVEAMDPSEAAQDQENSEYFVHLSTGTWNQKLQLVTTLDNGTVVGGVTANTDRNEVTFYSSMDLSEDTCITSTYPVDMDEGAENALYVGMIREGWTVDAFYIDENCDDVIRIEDTEDENIKKVILTEHAFNLLREGHEVWISVSADASFGDETENFGADIRLIADQSATDPYLTYYWLNDHEGVFFETDEGGHTGMGMCPTEVRYVIFYLNHWDNERNCMTRTPVHVEGGEHLFVNPVDNIAENQENAEYFCVLSTDLWEENLPVRHTMADGTVVTMDIWTGIPDVGFYTDTVISTDTWFSDFLEIDPFEENAIYIGLNDSNFDIQHAYVYDENDPDAANCFDLEEVNEKFWKLSLNKHGLDRMMGQYLLGAPVTLDVVNVNDTAHVEQRYRHIEFSRMALEGKAWLNFDREGYELFLKDGKQLWNHSSEDGNEVVDALPEGLTYDYGSNTLTMEDYHGSTMHASFDWYDHEEGQYHTNLRTDTLTIELKGNNTLFSNDDLALDIFDNLNVVFTGDGSLHIKTTNSPYNLDEEGHPMAHPAMNLSHGIATFAGDVNVTVEIAGEAMEFVVEDEREGLRPAHLIALNNEFSKIILKDNATLTTVLPDGACATGDVLAEGDPAIFHGHSNPGGYSGIAGSYDLEVQGGTLNTQTLSLAWKDDGTDGSDYTQSGGVVNIEGIAYINMVEDHDDEGNFLGMKKHYHFNGMEAGPGSIIGISGGTLNIKIEPSSAQLAKSTHFFGIDIMGATLNVSGGEVNVTGIRNGDAIQTNAWYYDDSDDVRMMAKLNLTGGTLNLGTEENHEMNPLCINHNTVTNLTGGTINATNGTVMLNGETVIENAVLNFENVRVESYGSITMNSGSVDLKNGMFITETMHHFGGEISITNRREGPADASLIVRNYYEMYDDAVLTICNEQLPPAIVAEGIFHQMGGTVDVTHINEEGDAAVVVAHFPTEEGEFVSGKLMLNDGTFTVRTSDDCHPVGIRVDIDAVLFVGGMEDGHKPVLTLSGVDLEINGIADLKQDAKVTVDQGLVRMGNYEAKLIMDGGAEFTHTVSREHTDDWDIAFLSGDHSNVSIYDATLTVTTEGFDCAFDLNGNYTQVGGTVTVDNTDGALAMAVKGVSTVNGGSLNLKGETGYSQAYEPAMSEVSRLVLNRGRINVEAQQCAIEILSEARINGGGVNLNVSGMDIPIYDENGNAVGAEFVANGILLYGWNYEDSKLIISGGTHHINVPVTADVDYEYAGMNGIRALQGKLTIDGGRLFVKGFCPVNSNSSDITDMLTLGDEITVYSLDSGDHLQPVDSTICFDENGEYTEDPEQVSITRYFRSFEEDNRPGNVFTGEDIKWPTYLMLTTNKAGETLTWKHEDGVLSFENEGKMYDYTQLNPAPWVLLTDFVTEVEMDSNVSYVGAYVFNGLEKLNTLTFLGSAPEFNENALAGVTADAYPAEGEPSWTVDLMQNYGGNINWVIDDSSEEVISLTAEKTTLLPAEKVTLTATVFPNLDPDVKVIFSLGEGDEDFVTLKNNNDGTATVTAKKTKELHQVTVYAVTDSGKADPVSVTLEILPIVTKVTILNDNSELVSGTTQTLYMSTTEESAMQLFAQNAPDGSYQEVTWKSSNTSYATVDNTGLVTALVPGKSVKITATAADGSKKYASVTIKTAQPMEDVTLPDAAVLGAGKAITLAADIYPEDTTNKKLNWEILPGGEEYASISTSGKLKAYTLTDGISREITVRVSAQENPGVFAECVVTIQPAVTAVNLYSEDVTDIEGSLNSKTVVLTMDPEGPNTLDLDAVNTPDDSAQEVTWKSSSSAATVDETGIVTGVEAGKTVTITATANDGSGKKATVKVKTVQPMLDVNLPDEASASKGKTIALTADIYPDNTTNKKLVWSLNEGDEAFAKISTSGKLTVAKNIDQIETVTVRVAAAEDPENIFDECTVTLYPTVVTKVNILNADGDVITAQQTVTMSPDGDNTLELSAETLEEEAPDEVTWKSSNTSQATVDEDGVVTVLVPDKTVTITATAADGSGKKATIKVKGYMPMDDLQLKENLVLDAWSNPIIAGGKSLKLVTALDFFPANASNQKLTWSVSDTTYATINPSTGVLAAKKVTERVSVEVTAISQDNPDVVLSFDVSIYPATTKVTMHNGGNDVTGKTLTLEVGTTALFEAMNLPENAANLYTWKSSDESYATVEDGEVTGLKAGKTVTITATAADGSGKKATVKIKVIEPTLG